MRGIARIIGFIFATGALVFVAAAAIFAGPGKADNGPSAESGVASSTVQDAVPLAH